MALRGVIFDMGGTLLHYNAPNTHWEQTEKTGARAVYAALSARGYNLPPEDDALDTAWQFAMQLWNSLTDTPDVRTLKLDYLLRTLAQEQWGLADLQAADAALLPEAYMAAIQGHVYPLESAAETLHALRERGLRIGLISNTLWPGAAHERDLERWGLLHYLEHRIFSADVEAWKPFRPVFQMGLDALGLQPDEAIYVGDSLYFDVWGAQRAGLRSVWIEHQRHWLPEGMEVTPDAAIRALPELLALVDGWR